jgi:hypothetical protein
LVERVVGGIGQVDAEVAEAARHRVVDGGVIGHVGVGRDLDVADQAVDDFRGFRVGVAVRRVGGDLRAVLPGVVHHLADEGRQLVEGQARAAVKLALLPNLPVPLVAQAGKADVIERG